MSALVGLPLTVGFIGAFLRGLVFVDDLPSLASLFGDRELLALRVVSSASCYALLLGALLATVDVVRDLATWL